MPVDWNYVPKYKRRFGQLSPHARRICARPAKYRNAPKDCSCGQLGVPGGGLSTQSIRYISDAVNSKNMAAVFKFEDEVREAKEWQERTSRQAMLQRCVRSQAKRTIDTGLRPHRLNTPEDEATVNMLDAMEHRRGHHTLPQPSGRHPPEALWWGVGPRPRFLERVERMTKRYSGPKRYPQAHTSLGFYPGVDVHAGANDEVRHLLRGAPGVRTVLGFLPMT